MDTKKNFIDFILKPQSRFGVSPQPEGEPVSEDGFDFLASPEPEPVDDLPEGTSFARYLLPHFFGTAGQAEVPLLGSSKALLSQVDGKGLAQVLPEEALLWDRRTSGQGPRYVILVEFPTIPGKELIRKAPTLFRTARKLDQLEDVMDRIAATVQDGMAHRTQSRDSSSVVIDPQESLVVVSVRDDREEGEHRWLVTFSSRNESGGFESFRLQEAVRGWERSLAEQHLGALYDRCFSKFNTEEWPLAFTTTEERTAAEAFVSACESADADPDLLKKEVVRLLDKIAMGFGLHNDLPTGISESQRDATCLDVSELPLDHDIGADPAEKATSPESPNPFTGITIRDRAKRLLGYIIYHLKDAEDAASLRKRLEKHNRFHNVLVVYPGPDGAEVELWQGRERLEGKLRKDQRYEGVARIVSMLSRFFIVSKAKVRNPNELAEELAYRAKFLRTVAHAQLTAEPDDGPLKTLYKAFQENLIRDQKPEEFADAFAQTITYGLLAARWLGATANPDSRERFTRATAEKYLVGTTPFLRELYRTTLNMQYGEQQARLLWLVDDIANLLDRVDVISVFTKGDEGADNTTDPIIHFYEPFLAAYDKQLKNKRGVFFTPRPVVSYIVNNVHELLQTQFGLMDGLASEDTWADIQKRFIEVELPEGVAPTEPFVCILDPATGTGSFLFEVIEVIEKTLKDKWCKELDLSSWEHPTIRNRWRRWVPEHLLPRLYGHEIMVASYAICHLKLAFKLAETGYWLQPDERLMVHLTNALEPPKNFSMNLGFAMPALAAEARAADAVKARSAFSVILGNPPYSIVSANFSDWIGNLCEAYKTTVRTKERQIQALSDDYVKFVRLGQFRLEQSHLGVMALITNNGYLDGHLFADMRSSLSEVFPVLLIVNLHGNIRTNERTPTGTSEENLFDIQTGVAITYGIRPPMTGETAVRNLDIWGTREEKYLELKRKNSALEACKTLPTFERSQPWVPRHPQILTEWSIMSSLVEIFGTGNQRRDAQTRYAAGFVSQQDEFAIAYDADELRSRLATLLDPETSENGLRKDYRMCSTSQWNFAKAREELRAEDVERLITTCTYRPFDNRYTALQRGVVSILRKELMRHLLRRDNIALLATRGISRQVFSHAFVADRPVDRHALDNASESMFVFPIYLYPDASVSSYSGNLFKRQPRIVNLAPGPWSEFAHCIQATGESDPRDLLFCVYAILHSYSYRKRYLSFLRTDFPRVPATRELSVSRLLAQKGGELVAVHLLRSPLLERPTAFPIGSNSPLVEKVHFEDSTRTVWLDKKHTCGFQGVPPEVWDFHIGGYQVCEKWLKDRKGRTLSEGDITHYRKIVVAISETIRIMGEIDEVIEEHGGWPGAFVTGKKQG